jgi:hypothetical protein
VPHNPHYSQDVTRVNISRRKKVVKNVACMGTTRNIYQVLVEITYSNADFKTVA